LPAASRVDRFPKPKQSDVHAQESREAADNKARAIVEDLRAVRRQII
jgi:hypothetical protein